MMAGLFSSIAFDLDAKRRSPGQVLRMKGIRHISGGRFYRGEFVADMDSNS